MTTDQNKDSSELSILFLCRKYYYLHKMSRVRFHAVRAIGNVCKVIWSGPGWENWDDSLSAIDNIKKIYKDAKAPDMVLCYKSEEIPGLSAVPYPMAVNRDELQTDENTAVSTMRIMTENKIDLVISHQKNQLQHTLFETLPCHFAYIPYCADASIFKDYGQEKNIDFLLIGNLAGGRYPLRAKLYQYVLKILKDLRFNKYKASVYPYLGYRLKRADTETHVIDYAQLINASKICLTCSGIHHLKYAKYVEVPACRTLLMADMPCEDQEILKEYLVEISTDITYEDFAEKLLYYLKNDEERKLITEKGYNIAKNNFTQQHYAEKFISIVEEYLSTYGHNKLWK